MGGDRQMDADWLKALDGHSLRISVVGLGRIGLPTALVFARAGFSVTGVDCNAERVKRIASGKIDFDEPGLPELLREVMGSGKFRVTTELDGAEIFILAVPTPVHRDGRADLAALRSAARTVGGRLSQGGMVIVESTVPPGTCSRLVAAVIGERTGLSPGTGFDLVHCPERVLPGAILSEIVKMDRIIGASTPEAAGRAKALYQCFSGGCITVTSLAVAELSKLMENIYRDVNIALANELALACRELSVDVREAIALANRHPRVHIHQPGIGVGGDCIPVASRFLSQVVQCPLKLMASAREVNDRMPSVCADRIEAALAAGQLRKNGVKIGLIGLAYKPDVADFRNSPALCVARELKVRGYEVLVWDPHLDRALPGLEGLKIAEPDELSRADLVVQLVAHSDSPSVEGGMKAEEL